MSCGHTVCKPCLKTLSIPKKDVVTCPFCRTDSKEFVFNVAVLDFLIDFKLSSKTKEKLIEHYSDERMAVVYRDEIIKLNNATIRNQNKRLKDVVQEFSNVTTALLELIGNMSKDNKRLNKLLESSKVDGARTLIMDFDDEIKLQTDSVLTALNYAQDERISMSPIKRCRIV